MKLRHRLATLLAAVLANLVPALAAHAADKEVTIAYQDMQVPWRVAQELKTLEKETGYQIKYQQFGGGGDVIRAMASGQVQIGEAGSAPIASAISQGLPVELFWILDDINDAEALVVRNGAGINSLADLKGKKIGVPFSSTTHFHTLVALTAAKVNPNDVHIVNLRPPEISAAWERGDIDATFVWDPVLAKVKQSGKVLVSSGKLSRDTGKATFDGLVVNKEWAKENRDFVVKFVKVLAAADEDYRRRGKQWSADSEKVKAIAKWTGAQPANVPDSLALYRFPTLKEQASSRWLGAGKEGAKSGGAAQSLAATAAFLKSQGTIAATLPDYGEGVNAAYVQAALK